jgi:hypothetical protein
MPCSMLDFWPDELTLLAYLSARCSGGDRSRTALPRPRDSSALVLCVGRLPARSALFRLEQGVLPFPLSRSPFVPY